MVSSALLYIHTCKMSAIVYNILMIMYYMKNRIKRRVGNVRKILRFRGADRGKFGIFLY